MKTTRKTIQTLYTMLVISLSLSLPMQVSAKSTAAKKALNAYKKMLSQEKIYIVPANTIFPDFRLLYDDAELSVIKKRLGYTITANYEYDEDDKKYYEEGVILKYSRQSDIDFAIAYIDKDDIPELVLRRPRRRGCNAAYVYTYRKGKVVRVEYPFSKMTFGGDGALARIIGYYKKKGVFVYILPPSEEWESDIDRLAWRE